MGSAVPTSIGFLLIAIGAALLAASYRIARLARSYRQRMENLLQLASKPIDPLDLPAVAWPDLEAGGWKILSWEGVWFGQPVSGELRSVVAGKKITTPLRFSLTSGDEVSLQLALHHRDSWGEDRLFAEHLARVFVLQLEMRLHARTEALSAALAERARLSLYLQHDMRNLAQWVLWVGGDFAACVDDEAMLTTARRLRDNAPLAMDRAQRLIAALGKNPEAEKPVLIHLHDAARQAARMAGLEPVIEGEATAWIAPGLLARALDNLFANIAGVWRDTAAINPLLQLRTLSDQQVATAELKFLCPWPQTASMSAEKLFEPFASGRPSGLGLGLYQARKSLREAGGNLTATTAAEGMRFVLQLPTQQM